MAVGQFEVRVDDAWIATAAGGNAEDEVRPGPGSQIWIRVNAQAGTSIFWNGGTYRLQVRLLRMDPIHNYSYMFSAVNAGNLNTPAWPTPDYTFEFGPIIAPIEQDTLLRVQTVLTSGVNNRGVNVFEGDMCVVTA